MDTPAVVNGPQHDSRLRTWLRRVRNYLIVAFVAWHLFFLFFRGWLDLWGKDFPARVRKSARFAMVRTAFVYINNATYYYGNFLGIEQGWSLFSGPLARSALFPAARIEFTDGTEAWVYSENEPDPKRFLRVGGWRQRKLEDYLCYNLSGDDLIDSPDLAVWSAYTRWSLRQWHLDHPDDPRQPEAIVVVTRRITFPEPGEDPCVYAEPEVETVGTFSPDGRLQ